jgi:hypothetical protein
MKKYALLMISLFAIQCGGKLTPEERKKLHDGMATQDIRRVTDAELHEGAIAYAAGVMRDIEKTDPYLLNKRRVDSISRERGAVIYILSPDKASLQQLENNLIEAYVSGAATGAATDNLQALGADSLLFTRPIFRLHPDGSQEFTHAIAIRMAKRTVVLSMPKP